MKFGILFILSVIVGILSAHSVNAVSSHVTDLSVSPAVAEWIVAPGQKTTKSFIVRNTTNTILPVQAFVQPMHIEEPMSEASKKRYDASQWFTVTDADFILRPQQSRKVIIAITVPKNAEPGGKYATVYFRQLSSTSFTPQTYVIPRVGVLSFVVVKGKITKWLQPEGIDVKTQQKTTVIQTRIQNSGNIHAFSQGSLIVSDWMGKEVARLPLRIGMVMPQTTRTFTNEWKPPTPGIYTVRADLRMGSQRLPEVSAIIWDLPWKEVLLVGVIVVLLWFGVVKVRHRWVRAWEALKN